VKTHPLPRGGTDCISPIQEWYTAARYRFEPELTHYPDFEYL